MGKIVQLSARRAQPGHPGYRPPGHDERIDARWDEFMTLSDKAFSERDPESIDAVIIAIGRLRLVAKNEWGY